MESLKKTHSKTRRAYNLAARAYHDLFHDELNDKAYDRALLDSFAARQRPGAVLCDAGCGPSAHIGRYLADKGMTVTGVDISDRCIEMAGRLNPDMSFRLEDMLNMSFEDDFFDGVVSYYSIIHTPKKGVGRLFREFHRVIRPGGSLLIAVKAGSEEGDVGEFLGTRAEIHFSYFSEAEITAHFTRAGFVVDFMERRNPYGFEIQNERIFAIGTKVSQRGRFDR